MFQPAFTCSKAIIKIRDQDVKYVQSTNKETSTMKNDIVLVSLLLTSNRFHRDFLMLLKLTLSI